MSNPSPKPPRSEWDAEQQSISAHLGEIVDRLRKERGLTEQQLAGKAELTIDRLRGIKKTHTDPSLYALLRLCVALDVSIGTLLGDLPLPKAPKPPKRPYYPRRAPRTDKHQQATGGRDHAAR